MARLTKRLTVKTVAALTEPGRHADGDGLYLDIAAGGSKSWVFLFRFGGKPREMGLGSARKVGLADARGTADLARKLVDEGLNPIVERKLGKLKKAAVQTFGDYWPGYWESIKGDFKNAQHKQQWEMTLRVYGAPLHAKLITDITVSDIHATLTKDNLWRDKPETASRTRGRIESVIGAAIVAFGLDMRNPARWEDNLEHLLPKPRKLTRGHHSSMPYEEIPTFVQLLRKGRSVAALALEFQILNVPRPGMIEVMDPAGVDFEERLWMIPKSGMKIKRNNLAEAVDQYIPLGERSIEILRILWPRVRNGIVFHGLRPGRPMSNATMRKHMDRLGYGQYVPHGFRTSFRDYMGDETLHEAEVAEHALAHKVADATQQTYRRRTALKKRRLMMEDWAHYVEDGRSLAPCRGASQGRLIGTGEISAECVSMFFREGGCLDDG